MSKKEILMPFDLDKAKAGAKLRTISGLDVRIICYDRKTDNEIKLVALVTDNNGVETSVGYTEQGYNVTDGRLDIKIVEEVEEQDRWLDRMDGKVKGWCLAYNGDAVLVYSSGKEENCWKSIFAKRKQAQAAAQISQIMANDKRFGGVITNEEWKDIECQKFIIIRGKVGIVESVTTFDFTFLAFHTREQRNLFLQENEELIKQFFMI